MAMYKMYDLNGDGTNDRLVIQWNQLDHHSSSPSTVTFQAVLGINTGAAPGSILLNYQDIDTGDATANGASATVGIRGPGTSPSSLQVSNGSSSMVGNNKAIKIGVPSVASITRGIRAPPPPAKLTSKYASIIRSSASIWPTSS